MARHVGAWRIRSAAIWPEAITAGEALSLSLVDRLAVLSAVAGACGPDQPLLFEITGRTVPENRTVCCPKPNWSCPPPGRESLHYLLTPLIYHGNRDLPDHLSRLGRLTRRNFILANRPDWSAG